MVHDVFFMQQAIIEAKKAYAVDEIPVGVVIVDNQGIVVARAYNQVEQQGTQLAHAEILALRQLATLQTNWRLEEYTIYVTLQPCVMCMGALLLSRIKNIVYGASSPVYGVKLELFDIPQSYKSATKIYAGICEKEISDLLKDFFIKQRQ
jgi:tRNA(adenine34) deaminase